MFKVMCGTSGPVSNPSRSLEIVQRRGSGCVDRALATGNVDDIGNRLCALRNAVAGLVDLSRPVSASPRSLLAAGGRLAA